MNDNPPQLDPGSPEDASSSTLMHQAWAAARALAADAATATIVAAVTRAGVRPILLKGPSLAGWLYEPGEVRSYRDVDLLVAPTELARSEEVLVELGYERISYEGIHRTPHADTWFHDGSLPVDLHRTLIGVSVPPEQAWALLADHTETIDISGTPTTILTPPGRALHLALHAAQHGSEISKPLGDLSRALQRARFETWRQASYLARDLGATEGFAVGLRLLPEGQLVADRLELPHEASTETMLRSRTAPPVALGIEQVAQAPGSLAKLSLAARKLLPGPAFMRAWSPLARRGPLGLAASYAGRPFWLLWRSVPAVRAWMAARTEARRGH